MVTRRIVSTSSTAHCLAAVVPAAVVALSLALAGTAVEAASAPPRNLHLVGDHWTAWAPPAVFPDGAQIYTIKPGDTLWDLAGRFYGNPYLWPQVWEANQYVLDSHWIYPGDPLVVGMKVMTPDELAEDRDGNDPFAQSAGEEAPVEAADEGLGLLDLDKVLEAPEALGSSSDVYCSGFIGDLDEDFAYRILGSEYDALVPQLEGGLAEAGYSKVKTNEVYGARGTLRYGLSSGDIIYLDGGRATGLAAGQLLTAIQPSEKVIHPVTGKVFGRFYKQYGRLRVLSVQENTAIAEITGEVCGRIIVGAVLRPFEPQPLPLGRRGQVRPLNYPSPEESLEDAPVILYSDDGVISIGSNEIVHIDRGSEDDVVQGDLFTVYRLNKPGLPPLILGEVAILAVDRRSATARVLETRFPMFVGDRLELK